MNFVLPGYCGMYCGACPNLLATREGKADADQTCHGCKSERPASYCATCGIKACARRKGIEFCDRCDGMATCELIRAFVSDTQFPYAQCAIKNLGVIQTEGLIRWLEMQEKRWQCGNCGSAFSWYHETCPRCGLAVASYKADV